MNPLPRPRCAPGERAILHAAGDPWDGCVVLILVHEPVLRTARCRLPRSQFRHARAHKTARRLLSTSDLF